MLKQIEPSGRKNIGVIGVTGPNPNNLRPCASPYDPYDPYALWGSSRRRKSASWQGGEAMSSARAMLRDLATIEPRCVQPQPELNSFPARAGPPSHSWTSGSHRTREAKADLIASSEPTAACDPVAQSASRTVKTGMLRLVPTNKVTECMDASFRHRTQNTYVASPPSDRRTCT